MFKKYFPDYAKKWLLLILVINSFVYNGTRLFTTNKLHYSLSNSIDNRIPLVSWTIIIYLGCYVFWIVNYVLIISSDKDTAKNFALSDISAKMICLLIYLVFPTTMSRGVIVGDGIFDNVLRFVYQIDAADNLFPSIHCLVSWLCYLGVRDIEKIPKWYKYMSLVMALMVFVSTLTVKQHVVLDVIAGFLLAEVTYGLCHAQGSVLVGKMEKMW